MSAKYAIIDAHEIDPRVAGYEIARIGELFVQEFMPHLTYDRAAMEGLFHYRLSNDTSFYAYILIKLDDEGLHESAVGMIIGCLGKMWCSTESVMEELAWYIEENHRGKAGRWSIKLLNYLYEAAKEAGAEVFLASAEESGNDSVNRIYGRMGMVPLETKYYQIFNPGG